jgi:hypothetical protein
MDKVPINPIIESKPRLISHAQTPTHNNMIMSTAGLVPENDCGGEGQQQL